MPVPAGSSGIVSLDDVHAHLNIPSSSHDAELQGFIDAATPVIEHITGPIESTTYTEYHDGGGNYLVLRHVPVLSVTSITEYRNSTATVLTGVATPDLTTTDSYIVEADTGIVRRYQGSGVPYVFWPGTMNVAVTYAAGYAVVPSNVRMAALELIRIRYQRSQLGGGGRQFGGGPGGPDLDTSAGSWVMGFFVPNEVREMLEPNRRVPGIA